MVFSLSFRAHSEIGLVRKNNQDSGFCSPRLIAVADGMGGAAAGDLASSVAIRRISRVDEPHSIDEAHEVLAGALAHANHDLADLVDADPALDGMGTTVTAALFTGTQLGMIHIGDSRAYLLRGGRLHRLTHDHSWVQSLVDEGKITEAEAAVHPHRSLLLKVLNGQPAHEPDFEVVDLQLDDRLLFCSDGLCGFVDEAEIGQLLAQPSLEDALDDLVEAAHQGGGADNITLLLADVLPQDDELDACEPVTIGAASEREIPVIAEHTLTGAEGIVLDVEPVAATERVVTSPAEVSLLDKAEQSTEEPDEETLRYAPRARSLRSSLLSLGLAGLLLAVLGGATWGGWRYAQAQFYVGESDQRVAIFQGIPGSLLGRQLSHVVEQRETRIDDLPPFFSQQVRDTIPVKDEATARTTADELDAKARNCIAIRKAREAQPTPSASASPLPSPTPSAGGSRTPAPGQAVTPSSFPSEEEC